jgi:hypothetical protein
MGVLGGVPRGEKNRNSLLTSAVPVYNGIPTTIFEGTTMGISVSFYTSRSDFKTSLYGEYTGLSYGTMGSILSFIGMHKEVKDLREHYGFSVDALKFLQAAEKALRDNRCICNYLGGHHKDRDTKEILFLRQMVRDYNRFRSEYGHKPRKFGGA